MERRLQRGYHRSGVVTLVRHGRGWAPGEKNPEDCYQLGRRVSGRRNFFHLTVRAAGFGVNR